MLISSFVKQLQL